MQYINTRIIIRLTAYTKYIYIEVASRYSCSIEYIVYIYVLYIYIYIYIYISSTQSEHDSHIHIYKTSSEVTCYSTNLSRSEHLS